MKLNFNSIFAPFYRIKNSTFFIYIWRQIFARNLNVKISIAGVLALLAVIWVLWLKIFLGTYPIIIPAFIKGQLPAVVKPYLLPLSLTIFVFMNLILTAFSYRKYPGIIYLILPINFYLEIIVLITAIYYLVKF